MGHTQARISRALACSSEAIKRLASGSVATVPAGLQADVEQLYRAWWDKRPPEWTRYERMAGQRPWPSGGVR